MDKKIKSREILGLPFDKRLQLVEDTWDFLAADASAVPIPDWHQRELRHRLARHQGDPDAVEPWDNVRGRLRSRTAKHPKA